VLGVSDRALLQDEEGRMLAPATHRSRNFQETTKTRASWREKAPRVVCANKNSGQATGARQQLKVIFAISKKAFAFGHIGQKKIYRED
jgi:hypothetical protein